MKVGDQVWHTNALFGPGVVEVVRNDLIRVRWPDGKVIAYRSGELSIEKPDGAIAVSGPLN